ncbi:hypothetical protein CC1G_06669 [Coprinopsis cinerea okayama7|uniref:Uncharacterized protein n=1 Tax=Coprinopsis cinerea (strain Okayama-7 / 130 / ATCC MYA-4618 / FGSC 9003) TaxID=240176 RepID=A8P7Y7_COPC7|nr:hypothetical protein CC1G_06669 [Coprinopsis cinerea okayama7\|eukprot:XP_001839456.2 hypothetical protein CC1G_06669 [Coprinopsis cinerea okayama7\
MYAPSPALESGPVSQLPRALTAGEGPSLDIAPTTLQTSGAATSGVPTLTEMDGANQSVRAWGGRSQDGVPAQLMSSAAYDEAFDEHN